MALRTGERDVRMCLHVIDGLGVVNHHFDVIGGQDGGEGRELEHERDA